MTRAQSHYVHGSEPDEQRRLSLLNDFINEPMLRQLDLRGGERILDLGSGLGQLSRAMARASGGASGAGGGGASGGGNASGAGPGSNPRAARVVGIERDPRQLDEAIRQAKSAGESALVEFRAGDAFDPPLQAGEWGTFDIAHTRFLLEHVNDPLAVVQTMVKAVRPGGRIVLADDDHELLRVWPALPSLDAVWRAYYMSYTRHGNDPYIGRKLSALLHDAGAHPRRTTWVFFGSCAGDPLWQPVLDNLIGILIGSRADILADPAISREMFEQSLRELDTWRQRPDAALWYSISWAEGMRPQRARTDREKNLG